MAEAGSLTQVCLTAGKGGVRIPDRDRSDSLSSQASLCPALPGTELAPGMFIQCMARSDLSHPTPTPSYSEQSFTLARQLSTQESVEDVEQTTALEQPPCLQGPHAGQRETTKVRSLTSWPSGAKQEPGDVKWGHGPSRPSLEPCPAYSDLIKVSPQKGNRKMSQGGKG